jgi:hypothetical protein
VTDNQTDVSVSDLIEPMLQELHVEESTTTSAGGVETTHRKVVMGAGGSLGPATVPHPELLAHGPLTVYFQPLDGEPRHGSGTAAMPLQAVSRSALCIRIHGF